MTTTIEPIERALCQWRREGAGCVRRATHRLVRDGSTTGKYCHAHAIRAASALAFADALHDASQPSEKVEFRG